jgi:hypothetical protein
MSYFGWMVTAALVGLGISPAAAQPVSAAEDTRAGQIAAQQAAKALSARPHEPPLVEALVTKIDEAFVSGHVRWHPFFGTAYQGAGFTAGVGYLWHVGDYDSIDPRVAVSLNGSKRAEVEFRTPRPFTRRGTLSVLGGWAEGKEQNFFGLGSVATSADDRTRFDFRQTYGAVTLDVRPVGRWLAVSTGAGYLRYEQRSTGDPAFTARYTAASLPGRGAVVNYVHAHSTIGLDSRPAAGYARRGGYYGVTGRWFVDTGGPFSFGQLDYEAVQHVPVLRDAWVLSVRARAATTYTGAGDQVPFFMMPFLGDATTLRGFSSMRFRDRHSLLASAEWRILINANIDTAFFYDTGKVASRRADLNLSGLKSNYGFGIRLHTLVATPFRIDLARGNEGFLVVLGATAAF